MIDFRPALVAILHDGIRQHEGGLIPGTAPYRQNNPCALVFVGQRHARPGYAGIAKFDTPAAGDAACRMDLKLKLNGGLNVDQILFKWNKSGYAEALKRERGLTGRESAFSKGRGD